MTELALTIMVLIAGLSLIVVLYIKRRNERGDIQMQDKHTMERLLDSVKSDLAILLKESKATGKSDVEFAEAARRKKRIDSAMKRCVYGFDQDKIIVQDLIGQSIRKHLPDIESVQEVVPFNKGNLDPMVEWEIILYRLKKQHGKDSVPYLIEKYGWAEPKYDADGRPYYAVTVEELDKAFTKESYTDLTYDEMIDVLSVLVYERYKGFGCIDTLREMNVDGINCGTSGSIMSDYLDVSSKAPKAPRSVWIFYQTHYIHLQFLTFGTEMELRRVVLLLTMYNNPGQLTEKRGYMITTMYDKTRILAVRPEASEYWAIFLRKFNVKVVRLNNLYIKGEDEVNAQLPVNLIKWFMRGLVTCAFTGRQGSGKTTAMIAAVDEFPPELTIRVLETTPEMYLRERYPTRNILSVAETQYVSAEQLQDALKKSDASISIVGEVASNELAVRMLQMAQVASLATIFSHHANRAADLVMALTNSIVNCSAGGASAATVQEQVLDAIHIDIHLDYDESGFRYFDRITEIIRVDKLIPEYDPNDPGSLGKILREYCNIVAVGQTFITRDLVRWDKQRHKYVACSFISDDLITYMGKTLRTDDIPKFKEFCLSNWKEV